jgi:CRP/FNR family cyclic AMP-dependent transcriptional regulator
LTPDSLKLFSLFAGFSEEDRDIFVELLEGRELPNGKSAFREGSDGEGLVLLERGRLKLKSRRTGAVVGFLDAPDHLGAASLFAPGKREVTALADGASKIWLLPRAALSRLLVDAPQAAFRLAEATAGELAGLMRKGVDRIAEADCD